MPGLDAAGLRAAIPATITLGDEPLQAILDGLWSAIVDVAGPGGTITELRDGGTTYVILDFRAESITSVSERVGDTTTELDDTDWELRGDHRSLRRRSDGSNPSTWWAGVVTVEYEAQDIEARLRLAQIELAKIELAANPALAGMTVGNWSIQYQQGRTYGELRRDVLESIRRNWSFA